MGKRADDAVFSGKTLFVTGGTGSFGVAVIERFLRTSVSEIRVFSRDEQKQHDLRTRLKDKRVTFYIGDVRDPSSLAQAMAGADFIYHAAALKQVPSCEFFPLEAVRTNVLGTQNVLDAAASAGADKVICLSTDKAVYPINAMGMTKALMEKLVVSKSRFAAKPTMLCTRYGNVLASRGSVVPLFLEQLRLGQPLTVTNPEMTRFLMTMEDALDLVSFAFAHGGPGDIFLPKPPAATVGQLARVLRDMFASPSEIKTIGARHGEKLYESLVTREEYVHAEDLGDYFRIAPDARDLNYDEYFTQGDGAARLDAEFHSHNARRLDDAGLASLLRTVGSVRAALERAHA
jgi:UDP-N-acetylglucosamine 4,6-dehydratase/5-epimerase